MKVNGTGSGPPITEIDAAESLEQVDAGSGPQGLSRPEAAQSAVISQSAHPASQAGRAPEMAHLVSDLSADLQAGRLSPEAAVDSLVNRILDRQLGTEAAPALREQIEGALRATLAEDPFVAAHVAALSRNSS